MLEICSLVVALSLSQAAPAAEATGRVAGRITLEGANTPISGVRVILVPVGPPTRPVAPMGPMRMGPPPQAISDQDGRYVFPRIRPGAYRLQVDKTGYAPLADGPQARTVQVVSGQSAEDTDVQMQRGAVIAGKVLDSAGEPLPDAPVMALRRVSQPGAQQRLMPAGGMGRQTNDLGEFRIAGLPPGEYYVAAMPRPAAMMFGGPGVDASAAPPPRTARQPRTTTATTYYPGTSDQAAAQAVVVAAGAEVGNIVFTMQSVASFRVSGVVVDEQGEPVGGAMVMLMGSARAGMFMGLGTNNVRTRDNGRFDIDDVPAGSYRANATIPITFSSTGGNAVGAAASGVVVSSGGAGSWVASTHFANGIETPAGGAIDPQVEVVVTDSDVKDVRVTIRRPAAK
jgi:protocatechuate 3,4-dioxygenase beta subunit